MESNYDLHDCAVKSEEYLSKWKCEMFGLGPSGLTWHPTEDNVPNWFWRKMQYVILGNKWIKED